MASATATAMVKANKEVKKVTLALDCTLKVIEEAKKENCDTVIFGHTHHAEICEEEGVTIINPGTCMKYCPSKTFVYLVINGKKITAVINDYALQNA